MSSSLPCDGTCGRTIAPDGLADTEATALYFVQCAQCSRNFCDRCVAGDDKRRTGHCDHCKGTLEHQTPASATHIVFAAQDGEATTQMFDRGSIESMLAAGKLSMPDGAAVPSAASPQPSAESPGRPRPATPDSTKRTLTIVLAVAILILLGGVVALLLR